MSLNRPRALSASALLFAAFAWLVSVTLCSTRAVATQAGVGHGQAKQAVAHEHVPGTAGHMHHSDSGQGEDHDCGCTGFNAFPAQSATALKTPAPLPAPPLFALAGPEVSFRALLAVHAAAPTTGPPGRLSPADLVRQRCRFEHAPPASAV
ncbi:MAG: hypothetical protein ACOZE5_03030 [Verrucomicrobiota bacterium]